MFNIVDDEGFPIYERLDLEETLEILENLDSWQGLYIQDTDTGQEYTAKVFYDWRVL